MAFQTIGTILQDFLKSTQWQTRINEIRLKDSWDEIMGKTISKYTKDVILKGTTLYISTDIAPLKHELQMSKEQIMNNINDFFKMKVVNTVVIR